ncbi:MAG: SRPBCC domain-containing protein [Candidatus Kaiserbacteria bacterium]|nr:SRPBCC domain-containing protein [Candidatus Kaiserbacteria bacterium]MCB9816877.1 SRPBCC domain-containing protein [Candidatus Nomurabacteria bacterium]
MKTTFTIGEDKKTLVATRTFAAPKLKLWEAYTTAELVAKWWGPYGWETEVPKLDFTVGGEWQYIMRCVDPEQTEWYGKASAGKGVYKEIDPHDSFSYTDYFTDESFTINENMPSSHSKIEFVENADGTTTFTATTTYNTEADLKTVIEMGMEQGYDMTLDRLEEMVTTAE